MPYIGKQLHKQGHEVFGLQQLNGAPATREFLEQIQQENFDIVYYEMLDIETFKIISELKNCTRILCYASKGIFKTFEDILKYPSQLYDKVLTNSRTMYNEFSKLGIECEHFRYYPAPLEENEIRIKDEYKFDFVYLGGGFTRLFSNEHLKEREVIYSNELVAKFGDGWENVPNYQGVLPPEDIGSLYASSKVSLATIEPSQRSMGMINNRYSEIMKAGGKIFSIDYPEMDFFGAEEFITFVNSSDLSKYKYEKGHHMLKKQQEFILDQEVDFFARLTALI